MAKSEAALQGLAVVAVLCAVVMTGITVRDHFFAPKGVPGRDSKPTYIKGWQDYAAVGHRMGPAGAKVVIIEFADFECPVCAGFVNGALRAVRSKHPNDIAIVFRHWPLEYHHLAYPAARAAECAGAQGRFEAFYQLVYAKQDSLGVKPLGAFARDAGVQDSAAFSRCNDLATPVPAVETDIAAAKAIGGQGTPTVLVNGLRLAGAPDSAALDTYVQRAMVAHQ